MWPFPSTAQAALLRPLVISPTKLGYLGLTSLPLSREVKATTSRVLPGFCEYEILELICPVGANISFPGPFVTLNSWPRESLLSQSSVPIAWDSISRTMEWIPFLSPENVEFRHGGKSSLLAEEEPAQPGGPRDH